MQHDTEQRQQRFIQKIKIIVAAVLGMVVLLFVIAYIHSRHYQRSQEALLTQYYQLRRKHPEAAKQALVLILQQDPNNPVAREALTYGGQPAVLSPFYEGVILPLAVDIRWVTSWFMSSSFMTSNLVTTLSTWLFDYHHTTCPKPIDLYALSLAGQFRAATFLPTGEYAHIDLQPMLGLTQSLRQQHVTVNMAYAPSSTNTRLPGSSMSAHDKLLNAFYAAKTDNPEQARLIIHQLLVLYPNDVTALKEAGYLYLAYHNQAAALPYFLRAYALTHDPSIAMQVAYAYNILGDNRSAYRYFSLATLNSADDPKLNLAAQIAMTNLAGTQLNILPKPWYAEVYYAPFYFSRFALTVNPLIARFGVVLNQDYQVKLYLSYSMTRDNRSSASNNIQISQIYNDDIALTAIGMSAQPLKTIPLVAFAQVGKAYNLLDIQPRWRNDFRGGLVYYQRWGAVPTFTPGLTMPLRWVGSVYADAIYYTRYQNTISDSRIRQGLRLFQAQSSTVDFYLTGHMVVDTQHQFYNNFFEFGPGIAITPSNRYNNMIRLESLRGYYFPVNSPSANPYGPRYHNEVVQIEAYLHV